jgi:hypothetical protein
MKHLSPVNEKAQLLARLAEARTSEQATAESAGTTAKADVVALDDQGAPQQPAGAHIPLGCSTIFSPGWEVDRTGGTAGLCQPVERDLFDCHLGCFWPAQVPDQLNHAPDWTKKCAAAQKDWRKIDLIFP